MDAPKTGIVDRLAAPVAHPLDPVVPVVLARRPLPGAGKTRLVTGGLAPETVAEIGWSLLDCTIEQLAAVASEVILALTPDEVAGDVAARLTVPPTRVMGQGDGDLGARIERLWRDVAPDRPVAFFGADCPDLPAGHLLALVAALRTNDLAVGPTPDGGYWTLAATRFEPSVLRQIDWGSDRVYDQTRRRAADAGLSLAELPAWSDVDRLEDLSALRRRLTSLRDGGTDALRRLDARLATLLE